MTDKDPPQNWRPGASLSVLQLRARVLHYVRDFFAQRGVLEVETPLLGSSTNPDPHIDSFTTTYHGPHAPQGMDLYLQTSPEFAMKRLLCAGSGPIYQICRAFRQGEWGAMHNPEFTILEWYRPNFDAAALMAEIDSLLSGLFQKLSLNRSQNLQPTQTISYRDIFLDTVDIDPLVTSVRELSTCVQRQGIDVRGLDAEDKDAWLDVLMTHCVQPRLGQQRLTFVSEYPISQAALARVNPANPQTALRFELFFEGMELANGFYELGDAAEQRHRFQQDLVKRQHHHLPQPPLDHNLLEALDSGMPDCSGVAIGLDRVVMLLADIKNINQVLAFPMGRV